MGTKTVLLIGTLDTKGAEIEYLRDLLSSQSLQVAIMDCGVLGESAKFAKITSQEIFAAAGTTLDLVRRRNDRGEAIDLAARGAVKVATGLASRGQIQGVLGIGGSAGSTIASAVMRALPYGLPKILVSTLASGQVGHYVGVRDICMMYSVVDFCGLNRFSRTILANAAHAMAGMLNSELPQAHTDRAMIASSMFGVTTPCVEQARNHFDSENFETLVFHATGSGGRTMEAMIRDRLFAGVLDITTTELADELVGGVLSAGKDRLTAAAIEGIPQVISVGALDMVNFGPMESVPEKFSKRKFYHHNASVTLMRTNPEENDRLGKEIAEKACASRGPTVIMLPLRGVSAIDKRDGPFWWPEADEALFQSIRNWVYSDVPVIELDLHINDPAFGDEAAKTLLRLMRKK
ncbi:Tm-1-like ATP-binding domain-containing protein [Telmatocola sphagniphila]|uniref:Tm-1-like ATP-binding domain-containing protein n=1 Tax=Telmatocola sphagniphila TaxID=1123043 RepID=A0A8E6B3P8_9BACT|nr:Tm-1-like ATP-binding domain-containing protein [Telmatocola sphagniphila]QVL29973.1 Tm-1-like ATP-binding domain-containing protein [Telmatocola sphagniphila]